MKGLGRFRPSPSMLVALLALVMATTGSAVAASLITSKQIKNGTIQSADISKKAKKQLKGARGARGLQGPIGPQGAQGVPGAKGDAGTNGTNGTDGAQGPPGPTAATGSSHTPNLTLTGTDQVVIDLDGENDQTGSQQITTEFDGLIMVSAMLRLDTSSATASRALCNAEISDGTGPANGLTQLTDFNVAHEFPATGSYFQTFPIVVSVSKPAGTYNVRIVCKEGSGDLSADYAELVVWAAK